MGNTSFCNPQKEFFMTQSLGIVGNFQSNVTFIQCMAGITLIGLALEGSLAKDVAKKITWTIDKQLSTLKTLTRESPAIVLASGIAFGVNQLRASFSTTPGFSGSIKVAQFVAAFFILKTGLSPFIEEAFNEKYENLSSVLRQGAVKYLSPMTICLFVAHYFNYQIKLAQSAALTGGVFILMKILEACLDGIEKRIYERPDYPSNNKRAGLGIPLKR